MDDAMSSPAIAELISAELLPASLRMSGVRMPLSASAMALSENDAPARGDHGDKVGLHDRISFSVGVGGVGLRRVDGKTDRRASRLRNR